MIGQQIYIDRDGQEKFIFQLVQSALARGVRLKITSQDGLTVTVPKRFHLGRLANLLEEKEPWILKHLQKMAEVARVRPAFGDGMMFTVLGKPVMVRLVALESGMAVKAGVALEAGKIRTQVQETEGELRIFYHGNLRVAKKILEEYLRKIAKKFFMERTAVIASWMGLGYNNVTVRAQKSRWGSCSRAKNLNFNWRLILAPSAAADYVIIHELAHTVHHNHSQQFYALVERYCPDYKSQRKFLRQAHFAV